MLNSNKSVLPTHKGALNDLPGPSAVPLARIPYFIHSTHKGHFTPDAMLCEPRYAGHASPRGFQLLALF